MFQFQSLFQVNLGEMCQKVWQIYLIWIMTSSTIFVNHKLKVCECDLGQAEEINLCMMSFVCDLWWRKVIRGGIRHQPGGGIIPAWVNGGHGDKRREGIYPCMIPCLRSGWDEWWQWNLIGWGLSPGPLPWSMSRRGWVELVTVVAVNWQSW